MTPNEFAVYTSDIQKADKMFSQHKDVSCEYREIFKRKFEADMYDIPYVSVFA